MTTPELFADVVSYEEFGRLFVPSAVTPERVAAAIRSIAGEVVEVGPLHAGPAGAATVTATATIATPRVVRTDQDPLSFSATLPVSVDLLVRLAGTTHGFTAELGVPIRLTVRTARPLAIVIEVDEIEDSTIDVRMQTGGLRQRVLRVVGNMDEEIRRQVGAVVRERIDSEQGRAARVIEIAPLIDRAWQSG